MYALDSAQKVRRMDLSRSFAILFDKSGRIQRQFPQIQSSLVDSYFELEKFNLDDSFTCDGCKPGFHFLLSCSEVNSTGYSEFDEPISARVEHCLLF